VHHNTLRCHPALPPDGWRARLLQGTLLDGAQHIRSTALQQLAGRTVRGEPSSELRTPACFSGSPLPHVHSCMHAASLLATSLSTGRPGTSLDVPPKLTHALLAQAGESLEERLVAEVRHCVQQAAATRAQHSAALERSASTSQQLQATRCWLPQPLPAHVGGATPLTRCLNCCAGGAASEGLVCARTPTTLPCPHPRPLRSCAA
jgi:hypothetical protein